MCLIIGGTVTYVSVKMARKYPDRRLWGLIAFVVIIFVTGIITLSVGISFIVKANKEEELPSFSAVYEPNLMQIRYCNNDGRTVLTTLLAQSPDGVGSTEYAATPVSDFQQDSEATEHLAFSFVSALNGVGRMDVSLTNTHAEKNVACYEVSWKSDSNWLQPTDCFPMAPYGDFWFGGAEMYYQWWPINRWNKTMSFYLSGDMYADAQQYGSVLDRYWISSSGVGLFVHDESPLHASIENQRLCFKGSYSDSPYRSSEPRTPFLRYTVCLAPDARQIHEYMFLKSGFFERPDELPDLRMMRSPIWSTWARYKQNVNQSIVLSYASEIEENGFSNSQIEIDDGYEAHYGDYTFDPEKFPDAKGMIDYLHDHGFRVTTWVTPFVNPGSEHYADENYFVKNGDGDAGLVRWWNGFGRLIDFTDPESCDWYVQNLEAVKKDFGVDSFKFDAGEVNYLTAIESYTTKTFLSDPGTYTKDYAECAHRLGNQIEVRAAWKNQDLPVFVRMMDKDSNWSPAKGLKTIIPTALTFSVLGYPYILPDMIGGNAYEDGFLEQSVPERELYIRWLTLTAFLPSMQFSISPWQYDDEVTTIARDYVELHEGTIYDELKSSFQKYIDGETGMGAIRPIWWIAPGDLKSFQIDDEFLVGDKYLVAPIVNNASRSRDVYLPGPLDYNGKTLLWIDKLRPGGNPLSGGQSLVNYQIALDEISWWEKV